MKDIKIDPFKEYKKEIEPGKQERLYNWEMAIGLQDVDKLKPSDYLYDIAKKNIDGDITIEEAGNLIKSYYKENPNKGLDDGSQEADLVSQRISELLSTNGFTLSVISLLSIHKKLFTGVLNKAGELRDFNITKDEWILNGDTVIYGDASQLKETIEYDLNNEKTFKYTGLSEDEKIKHIATFIADLWQIHPFREGNTRTTAVFLIKYLRMLGYKNINNEPFKDNSWYFRNSLVRANYYNSNVDKTTIYLELFLRNLLLGEHNELKNRYLHIDYKKED